MDIVRHDMTRYDFARMIGQRSLKHGVEIGVLHGAFSYYLLRHSSLEVLWSVDAWQGKHKPRKADVVTHLSEFGERSRIVHARSTDAAELAAKEGTTFDFVFIDAGHLKHEVQSDIDAWLPLTRRPCLFAGHDYLRTRKVQVIPIVNALAEQLQVPVNVTRETWASWFFWLE
jgi:predicted O-methyltransferase YrrM